MNRYSRRVKTKTHTHCISIGKIPKCQLLFLTPKPHPPTANSGIVLQAGKVLVHLLLLWKKRSLFILFRCLLGNIWKKLKGWMTKGSAFSLELLHWRIVWRNGPSAGGQPALGGALARERHRAGPGLTEDPMWGTVLILVGPHVTKGLSFFVMLGARPREWISHLAPLLKIKRNKGPLLEDIVKKSNG